MSPFTSNSPLLCLWREPCDSLSTGRREARLPGLGFNDDDVPSLAVGSGEKEV